MANMINIKETRTSGMVWSEHWRRFRNLLLLHINHYLSRDPLVTEIHKLLHRMVVNDAFEFFFHSANCFCLISSSSFNTWGNESGSGHID